jgi:hypothetical protein
VIEVLDFIQDEDLRSVLLAAASLESLIPADKAVNAAKQNLDTLEIRHIDEALRTLDTTIATCNISDDESSYFVLLRNRQALQQRKDAIRRRFAR